MKPWLSSLPSSPRPQRSPTTGAMTARRIRPALVWPRKDSVSAENQRDRKMQDKVGLGAKAKKAGSYKSAPN
jgi:hypothetical protein